jgi:hypothetical protein
MRTHALREVLTQEHRPADVVPVHAERVVGVLDQMPDVVQQGCNHQGVPRPFPLGQRRALQAVFGN